MIDATIYRFDDLIGRQDTGAVKWECYLTGSGLKTWSGTALAAKERRPLSMWVADMDFPSPRPVIDALQRRLRHPIFGYTKVTDGYRQAVCRWMQQRWHWSVQPDWILPIPGVVPALHALVRTFAGSGQAVIVQPPVYYPFFRAIQGCGAHIVENPLVLTDDGYAMDFDDLERKAASRDVRMAILCSPHNPVGRVWRMAELGRFAAICQRHGVLVVADEIHADLLLGKQPFHAYGTLRQVDPAMMVSLSSASKTFNLAGLHTGNAIIADARLRQRFAAVAHSGGLTGVNPFGAAALEAAYNEGENWLGQLLAYLKANLKLLIDQICDIPALRIVPPEGTYLAWIDFRGLEMEDRALEQLLQQRAGVYLDPGEVFGTGGHGFQRMNFAAPRSLIIEAMQRIKSALPSSQ